MPQSSAEPAVVPEFIVKEQTIAVRNLISVDGARFFFSSFVIGKTLPQLWRSARPHALMGTFLSLGQFALGGLAVLFLLGRVFGLPVEAGSLLEMSFAGGHGTIAGMGSLLVDAGAGELVDIALGLATISIVTGVVIGSALVRWAVRNPSIPVMRDQQLTGDEDYDLDVAAGEDPNVGLDDAVLEGTDE